MKKLIILIAVFAVCKSASGQILTAQDGRFNFFDFSIGGGVPVVNNKDFNNWSETNYHSKKSVGPEAMSDFYYVGKNYDLGIEAVSSGDIYNKFTFYFGRRITSPNSPVTIFLNIGAGGFIDDIYDYAPVGFQPIPDATSHRMYMEYTAGYLALQSRNYINSLGFNISRNRRINFKSGFYVNFDYRPWGAGWQYGYDKNVQETDYDDDGDPYTSTTTQFDSHKAEGVPALAAISFDAGVFVSITLSTVKKHGYYSK